MMLVLAFLGLSTFDSAFTKDFDFVYHCVNDGVRETKHTLASPRVAYACHCQLDNAYCRLA